MSNDQWLSEGDCDKCRRVKYCKKECTAHRKFLQSKAASYALALSADMYCKMMRSK